MDRPMVRVLLLAVCLFGTGVAAANNDDGFLWVDANTKIRVKPVGKSAADGASKAPEPKKDEKKEKPKN
jgi:hypothetical protein